MLRRLAVFSGGFTLESAEAVAAAGDTAAEDVLDLVTRLVDCSLLVAPPATGHHDGVAAGGPRYRMPESVRTYGLEWLAEAGEAGAVRTRHAEHVAERASAHPHGPEQPLWLDRLDAETLNLWSALDLAVATGAGRVALRLVNAASWYWFLRGRIGDARRAPARALERADGLPGDGDGDTGGAGPREAAGARARLAAFTVLAGQARPFAPGVEAFVGADLRGRWLLEFARLGFADACGDADDSALDELPCLFRDLGDRWGEAVALSCLATRALYRGDLAELRRNAGAAAAAFGELGDRWGLLQSSEQLGILAEIGGDYPEAARLHRDGLHGARELRLWTQVSFLLARLGRTALLTGDHARADALHEEARALAAEQSHRPAEQFAEIGLALGARRRGDLDAAATRLLPWLDGNRRLGADSGHALILPQLGYVAELRGDAERAYALHRDGLVAARRSGDPRALALAFEGLAGAASAAAVPWDPAGRAAGAAGLLGTAAVLRDSLGTPLPPAEREDADRATARLRSVLGDEVFGAEFARGRTAAPDAQGPCPPTPAA
ncbi:ATP-binding protein [Streptomyces manipurensis]|uniref:ATP-binding protein n=1 Tax=Streptomyces manipurensis TaxID=1077945 RepID=UPI003C702CD7